MKNKMVLIVTLCLFVFQTRSNAQPSNAKFYLFNTSDTRTDAAVFIRLGCTRPMPFYGYLSYLSNDTFYIQAFWGFGSCNFGGVNNLDTMGDVELPAGTNFREYNSSIQAYDTTWNKKDSTFALHPVGINDVHKNIPHISVYPNPANNTLFLEGGPEYKAVHVYNIIGQRVGIYPYNNTKSIDISRLAKGSYFLKLTGKQEESIGWARFVKTAY